MWKEKKSNPIGLGVDTELLKWSRVQTPEMYSFMLKTLSIKIGFYEHSTNRVQISLVKKIKAPGASNEYQKKRKSLFVSIKLIKICVRQSHRDHWFLHLCSSFFIIIIFIFLKLLSWMTHSTQSLPISLQQKGIVVNTTTLFSLIF